MKLFSRATVSGTSLTGASLKATLTALWDAMNSAGFSDVARSTVTTTSTLLTTQCGLLLVDATSGSITLTLPASGTAADDAFYMLRRIDSTANIVTVLCPGSDTVEGVTSFTLPPNSTTKTQLPGGSINWRVIGISAPTAAATRAAISASSDPMRNRAINGDMAIDPNNSASTTFTAAAALQVANEMFYGACTGANVTGQQIAQGDGTFRYRFTGAASNASILYGTRIEAQNVRGLPGLTATLSAKLSSVGVTSINWTAYYANTGNTFGPLGAYTRTLISSGTFTITSAEAVYSAQIAIPAAAFTGIEIVFTTGALVAGQTLTFGDTQLEKGAISLTAITPEFVDIALQTQRCQRYFEIGEHRADFYAAAAYAASRCSLPFKVTKRVVPQMVKTADTLLANISSLSVAGGTPALSSFVPEIISTAIGSTQGAFTWSANARLF